MTREIVRVVLSGALLCLTAAVTLAQTTTTSETKKFQVIAVDGNQLVVKLPEGTRELTVPADFQFNIDGKMLSVNELKPGMAGTATITTRVTTVPVTVTEVKNGTVMQAMGTSIIVRTDEGMKMFSQSDIDKRGVKIMREGKPAQISDFRANDRLTATIITTKPPRVHDREGSTGNACQEQCRCRDARRCRAHGVDASAGSRAVPARGSDLGRCAEEPAQDRQPPAGSSARGPRVTRCGVGPHRQAASRDALAGSHIDAGPRSLWEERGPAQHPSTPRISARALAHLRGEHSLKTDRPPCPIRTVFRAPSVNWGDLRCQSGGTVGKSSMNPTISTSPFKARGLQPPRCHRAARISKTRDLGHLSGTSLLE